MQPGPGATLDVVEAEVLLICLWAELRRGHGQRCWMQCEAEGCSHAQRALIAAASVTKRVLTKQVGQIVFGFPEDRRSPTAGAVEPIIDRDVRIFLVAREPLVVRAAFRNVRFRTRTPAGHVTVARRSPVRCPRPSKRNLVDCAADFRRPAHER